MKCHKCFFACFIDKRIYGVPILHCKYRNKNFTYDDSEKRDYRKMGYYTIGCNIPWQTVEKAKRDCMKEMMNDEQ